MHERDFVLVPMAEAEDPEVMGDELAIVMFNLYQLGPMGRYIYIYILYHQISCYD